MKDSGTSLTATALNGGRVQFVATAKPAPSHLGDVTTHADTLLVVTGPHRSTHGVVPGANSLTVGGQSLPLSANSAELALGERPAITREIHPPIQPVRYSPDVNVFTDYSDVTMTSATPLVSIRYALDGTEPTFASLRAPWSGPSQSGREQRNCIGRSTRVLSPSPRVLCSPGKSRHRPRARKSEQPGLAWEYSEG